MKDFFAHQDAARRQSRRLAVIIVVCVFAVVAAVYALLVVALAMSVGEGDPALTMRVATDWRTFAGVAGVVIAIVGLTAGARIASLRGGGAAVAHSVGAREVPPDTRDPDERKLRNVVEEMAIASSVPVPRVFVIDDEASINAFAAGYAVEDAAVAVTRGCMQKLSRDELQGVVAHEFSHILNGDMRLNIRLIGGIAGLAAIGTAGRLMLRAAANSSGRRRSSRDGGNPAAVMLVVGLGLIVIGAVGAFCARLLQAAVSRQREFLADASGVQFTRNPKGLAGALAKVAGDADGGRIQEHEIGELRHMFFADAMPALTRALATHPPLDERIRRLGGADASAASAASAAEPGGNAPRRAARGIPRGIPRGAAGLAGVGVAAMVGAPAEEDVTRAADLIATMPRAVLGAAHDATRAPALLHALLLSTSPDAAHAQIASLVGRVSPDHVATVRALAEQLEQAALPSRLAVIELLVPTLRLYDSETRAGIVRDARALAAVDGLTLAEVLLLACVERWLLRADAPLFTRHRPAAAQSFDDIATLVRVLGMHEPGAAAHSARLRPGALQAAFDRSLAREPSPTDVVEAVDRLALAPTGVRRLAIEEVADAALLDRRLTRDEADVCAALATLIHTPLPLSVTAQAA